MFRIYNVTHELQATDDTFPKRETVAILAEGVVEAADQVPGDVISVVAVSPGFTQMTPGVRHELFISEITPSAAAEALYNLVGTVKAIALIRGMEINSPATFEETLQDARNKTARMNEDCC